MSQIAYLMRHATPDWTRTDIRYDIPPGPPLTEQGEAEALASAKFLAPHGITAIFASPLERTQRTAQIVAQHLGVPLTIEHALAEWRQGESEDEVCVRCSAYWEALWDAATGAERPLLVTHGGPVRLLLQELGLIPEIMQHYRNQFDQNNPLPPAGVWQLSRPALHEPWDFECIFTPVPHIPYEGMRLSGSGSFKSQTS